MKECPDCGLLQERGKSPEQGLHREDRGGLCGFCGCQEVGWGVRQDETQVPGEEMCDQEACSWTQAHQWYEDDLQSHWVLKKMWLETRLQWAQIKVENMVNGCRSWKRNFGCRKSASGRQHQTLEAWRLAALNGGQDEEKPPLVLQTYTVPLAQVRRELHKWVEPFKDEYTSLSQTTQATFPTTEEALKLDPRYPDREEAPAMLVPTVKSPHGRHRARVVICGNHLTRSQAEEKALSPLEAPTSTSPLCALCRWSGCHSAQSVAEEKCFGRVDDSKPGR